LSKFLRDISTEIFTTQKVFDEVVHEGKKKGAPEESLIELLFKEETIRIRNHSDNGYLEFVKEIVAKSEKQPLHEAEAGVLSLAKEVNGITIADDKVVRKVANLLEIELPGTANILGKLYMNEKIKKEDLIEKVKEMYNLGWHVSAEDYLKIIEYLKCL
jgi:predicted nucleic acid-binding protein